MMNEGPSYNIIEVTELTAPELEVFHILNEPQLKHYFEPDGGIFIAESPNVITRALDSGCEPLSLLLEPKHIEGQAADIVKRCSGIPVYTAPLSVLTEITGFRMARGVLCAMRRPAIPSMEEVCGGASRIAILDEIMNPTNVGAIFRSAAALGMDAVLLTGGCADPFYRRAARVSMGTVFQIPWAYIPEERCSWPGQALDELKKMGFASAAMALSDDSVSIDDEALGSESRLAVILGNEGEGLSENTIAACDYTVRIPMMHGVDSLNVAAASAVAFWQLRTH